MNKAGFNDPDYYMIMAINHYYGINYNHYWLVVWNIFFYNYIGNSNGN